MAIYVYPADAYGCGHYRLIWPGLALADQGHDVKVISPSAERGIEGDINAGELCPKCGTVVVPFDPERGKAPDGSWLYFCQGKIGSEPHEPVNWTGIGKMLELRVPDDAEAVILQRVTMKHLADGIGLFRKTRPDVAVIVDMDDDLRVVNPNNPAFLAMHEKHGYAHHNAENAMRACLNATLVTVSTPALLKVYAPHGRGVVLYNRVPRGYLDIPHEDSSTMSWPGSLHSHPWDLDQVGPAVQRLVRAGHTYLGVGSVQGLYMDRDGRRVEGPIDEGQKSLFTELVPPLRKVLGLDDDPDSLGDIEFGQWPWAVAKIGVGLAPLADGAFNRSKSWLKPLEMSATGVPWVASPREEYVRLHREHSVGMLAKDPKEWYQRLRQLVTSESLRREQSLAGRTAAAANTVEGHAWRWLEVWEQAITAARRSAPVYRSQQPIA